MVSFHSLYDLLAFHFTGTTLTDHPMTPSFGARLKVFVSGSLIPALPEIAKDLSSDVAVIRYARLVSFVLLVEEIPPTIVGQSAYRGSLARLPV